MFELKSLDI